MSEPVAKISSELAAAIYAALGWGPLNSHGGLRAQFHCEYCGRDLLESVDAYDSWQIDHKIPMVTSGTNDLENVALSCRTCNHLKHTYVPAGNSRADRLEDARNYVRGQRTKKQEELDKLRAIVKRP